MEKDITLKLGLIRPYHQSVLTVYDLVNIWNFKLIKSGTELNHAIIKMPKRKFKKIFGKEPTVGKWTIPAGTTRFLSSVEVMSIGDQN
jgi:hypothetical protein